MAECLLTTGFAGLGCPPATPGGRNYIYLANLTEIDTWTPGTAGIYTNFTMVATEVIYKVEISKDTLDARDSLQGGDQDLGSYDQEVEFVIKSMSVAARNAVNSMNGPNMVAFVPTKNGEVFIMGKDIGMKMVTNDATLLGDSYGETVILKATQMPGKREFLDAGTMDTTIALFEAKL